MLRAARLCFFVTLCATITLEAAAANGNKLVPGRYRVHRAVSLQLMGTRVTPKIWTSRTKTIALKARPAGELETVTLEGAGRMLFAGYLTAVLSHPPPKGSSQRPTTQIVRPRLGDISPGDAVLTVSSNRPAEPRTLELKKTRSWGPFGFTKHWVGRSVP